mmetsp:Transcript_18902/g.21703  ORF Transcript_18902/g.21703 Transcript_18902/m.21703 type:complete len:83 (-) Transcript_18902:392-640(-)
MPHLLATHDYRAITAVPVIQNLTAVATTAVRVIPPLFATLPRAPTAVHHHPVIPHLIAPAATVAKNHHRNVIPILIATDSTY